MLKIELPWPDSRLYAGNARIHYRLRAELARGARHEGRMLAMDALGGRLGPFQTDDKLTAVFTFAPPDRRGRDIVNVADACKSYVDGVFDALGVNDKQIHTAVLSFADQEPGGRVTLELEKR